MEMKECTKHPGKMYWLENEERYFNNLVHYTNDFIVTYHDDLYPDKIFYKKFSNGVACVKWATKLNENKPNRIGLHRFFLSNVDEEYIRQYEHEQSPNKELVSSGRGQDKQPRTRRTKQEMELEKGRTIQIDENIYNLIKGKYDNLDQHINDLLRQEILNDLGV